MRSDAQFEVFLVGRLRGCLACECPQHAWVDAVFSNSTGSYSVFPVFVESSGRSSFFSFTFSSVASKEVARVGDKNIESRFQRLTFELPLAGPEECRGTLLAGPARIWG